MPGLMMNNRPVCILVAILMAFSGFQLPLLQAPEASAAPVSPVKWARYANNPVLSCGPSGSWDDASIMSRCVIQDAGELKLYYTGWDGSDYAIGLATSADGTSWTKYAKNPILQKGVYGSWEETRVESPWVIKDGSGYHMWYIGWTGIRLEMGYASSRDGINFDKYPGNPAFKVGSPGAWDSSEVAWPTVLKENGQFRLWYAGGDGSKDQIGYAVSDDGLAWTRSLANPVLRLGLANAWDDSLVSTPCVVNDSGVLRMWYGGYSGRNWGIGYATLNDGFVWTKHASNPVLAGQGSGWESAHTVCPAVLYDGLEARMWYTGGSTSWTVYGIGYAVGSNPDLDAPALSYPAENQWANSTMPAFGWRFNDLNPKDAQAGFQLQLGNDSDFGSLVYDSGWKSTWSTSHTPATALLDGSYYWRVRVRTSDDELSDWSEPWKIGIDSVAPVIGSFCLATDTNVTPVVAVKFLVTAEDPLPGSGILEVRTAVNAGAWSAWTPYQASLDLTLGPPDGNKTIGLQVRDGAGNPSLPVDSTVLLDTAIPSGVSLRIDGGASLTNSTSVILTITARDPEPASGLDKMSFGNDGTTWGPWVPFSGSLARNLTEGDGRRPVYVRVMDRAGNIGADASSSIVLDTLAPVASISQLAPVADDADFTVGWRGSDATSDIKSYDVQYRDEDGPWTDWLRNTNRSNAVFRGQDGHNYSFRVRARDIAGNLADYPDPVTSSVRVDVQGPVVSLLQPLAGQTLGGKITVRGIASHPKAGKAVTLVQVQLDGGGWETVSGTESWKFTIDTTNLENGPHTVQARATDGTKSTQTPPVDFSVKNEKTGGIGPNLPWILLVVLVVAAAAGAAGYLALRKRTFQGRPEPGSLGPESASRPPALYTSTHEKPGPPGQEPAVSMIRVEDLEDETGPVPPKEEPVRPPEIVARATERSPEDVATKKAENVIAARESTVLKALSSLPRGLPSPLWGIEMDDLASRIVGAERKDSPDGDMLVRINNRWFYGDETNLGMFMQEYKK